MMKPDPSGGSFAVADKGPSGVDRLLGGLVIVSACVAAWRLWQDGYLPQPFYYLKSDTLMDWYNTAYWSNRPGAYDVWGAIYPPLSLDFLRLFSLHGCYGRGALVARDCDWLGQAALLSLFIANGVLVFLCYQRAQPGSRLVRTLALSLGFPMLFALDRGNLVIPAFTCFVLSESSLLRREWQRTLAFALAANLKPYLLVVMAPLIAERQWSKLAGRLIACLAVYAVSYFLEGAGSPAQLVHNAAHFVGGTAGNYWNDIYNPTSYIPLLDIIFFDSHVRALLPAWLIQASPIAIIGVMALALAGVLVSYGAVFLRRAKAPPSRLTALALAAIFTTTGASGYSEIFVLFLVFFETWRGPGAKAALIGAYLLSLSADLILFRVPLGTMRSWLFHRDVIPVAGVALGQFARPALLLLVQLALVAATLSGRLGRPGQAHLDTREASGPAIDAELT